MEDFFFTPTNETSKDGQNSFGEDKAFSDMFSKKESSNETKTKESGGLKNEKIADIMSFFDSKPSSEKENEKSRTESGIAESGISTQPLKQVESKNNQSKGGLFDFFTPVIQEKAGEKKKEPSIQTKEDGNLDNLDFGDFEDGGGGFDNEMNSKTTKVVEEKSKTGIADAKAKQPGKEEFGSFDDDGKEEKAFGSFDDDNNEDIFDYADPKNLKEEETKDIISSIPQPVGEIVDKSDQKEQAREIIEDVLPSTPEKDVNLPKTEEKEVRKDKKEMKSKKSKKNEKVDNKTPSKKKNKWSILKMFDQFPSPAKKKDNIQTYEIEKGEKVDEKGKDPKIEELAKPASVVEDSLKTPEIDMDTLLFTQSPTFPDDHPEEAEGELEEWEKLLIDAAGPEVKSKKDMVEKAPLCLLLYEIFLIYVKALDIFRMIEDEPDLRTIRRFIETRKMRVFMRGLIDLDLIVQFSLRRLPSKQRNQLSMFVDHFRGVLKRMIHGGEGYFKKEASSGELKLKTAVMGVIFKNSCRMTGKQSENVCKWGNVILDVKVANFWKTFCSSKPPKIN